MNLMNLPAVNARYLQFFSFSFKGAGEIIFATALLLIAFMVIGFVKSVIGLWSALTFVWVGSILLVGVPMLMLALLSRFDRR